MRKPKAIVCDDSDVIRDVVSYVLRAMGYEVLTVDAPITCAFYKDNADVCPRHNRCADILIADHAMPGMTGMELLEMQHRAGRKLISQNKALMTGIDDPDIKNRAAALGCQFFQKPALVPALQAWIRECEGRFDLSESLASELFLPRAMKSLVL